MQNTNHYNRNIKGSTLLELSRKLMDLGFDNSTCKTKTREITKTIMYLVLYLLLLLVPSPNFFQHCPQYFECYFVSHYHHVLFYNLYDQLNVVKNFPIKISKQHKNYPSPMGKIEQLTIFNTPIKLQLRPKHLMRNLGTPRFH